MADHVHIFIPVATTDWRGKPIIARKCACGDTQPEQTVPASSEAGEEV